MHSHSGSAAELRAYFQLYFQYLAERHPTQLIKFLQEDSYEAAPTAPEGSMHKIKGYVVEGFWQGMDLIKKKLADSQPRSNVHALEKMFRTQAQLAETLAKSRAEILKSTGIEVMPSVYEQNNAKYDILAQLHWLIGFELALAEAEKQAEKLLAEGHKVQADKLKRMIQ